MGEFIGEVISASDKCFVLKTKMDINSQDGLCFVLNNELMGCLVNKAEKVKEGVKVFPNKKVLLTKGDKIYRNIDVAFNKTLENSKIMRKLEVNFEVYQNKLCVFDMNNNKASFEFSFEELANNQEKMKENFEKSLSKTSDLPYFVSKIDFKTEELPFLPVSKINELRREVLELLSEKILSKYKTKKQKPITLAKFPFEEGDYKLNVHNSKVKEFYENCACEVLEDSFESEKKNKTYELMRTKHCLKRAFLGCKSQDELFLVDEKGVKYPLKFECENCEMVILSPTN